MNGKTLLLATFFAVALPAWPAGLGTVICESKDGARQHCPADTSAGAVLVRATGSAACLLGRSWGYDAQGIWVTEGCGGEFAVAAPPPAAAEPGPPPVAEKNPEYIPMRGFRLYEGEKGEIYMRLFTYARYLNQESLDPTYENFFGDTLTVKQREDIQLLKFFLPFSGWFMTPKFRYYLYVWSANTAQGDPAQVVGAGNISYVFSPEITAGFGITSLPSTRSTEGQFPYWLGVDDRLTSDEFFRGSYTSGIWVKGELPAGLNYMAMLGNNLSTLGVSASQLDNGLNTTSIMINWLPTTKEFGPLGAFGDFEGHTRLATRIGAHWTRSIEDQQAQPGTENIENSQIRLTDGSVIFTDDLFGPGIDVDRVTYEMTSIDAAFKYRGFAVEAEYYWRNLSDFSGTDTSGIAAIDDHGYQVQTSAMVLPQLLQIYLSGAEIKGRFGDSEELRAGFNWHFRKTRGLRLNAEWLSLDNCPVGYTAVPYPVGGNGDVYHANLEMNF